MLKRLFIFVIVIITAVALFYGWRIYDRQHGIRFYELPVKAADEVKVSIVVPVYNAEDTIERALDSLRRQTLKDIEIICVDDGSTDGTPAVLKRYAEHDKRIKVITQQNAFVGAARNRGMREAKGEYIGFMDNDDWVSPNYFEELYKAAKEYDADLAVAENIFMVIKEQPLEYVNFWLKDEFKGMEVIHDLAHYEDAALGYVWEKLYRKSFLLEHNIWCTTRRTSYEDNYFTTQAYMHANKMAVAHGTTYYYFRGGKSYSLTNKHKPTDEAPEMFLELQNIILNAGFYKEKLQRWLIAARNIRVFSFVDYYKAMDIADRPIWRQKVLQAFPYDGIDFDQIDASIAQQAAAMGNAQ